MPLLFIDLTEEAAILYDKNSFLEALLLELKKRLLKQGARRARLPGGRWYWNLASGYGQGEKIAAT